MFSLLDSYQKEIDEAISEIGKNVTVVFKVMYLI